MANTIIQLKHSTVQGNIPVSLANGEISINTRDGKLFYSDPTGTVQEFSGFTGPSGLNREVQFNDSGVLGANALFTFNKTLPALNVGGVSLTNTYIQFGDGTRQYTANGAATDQVARNTANAAFLAANAATATDTTQNNSITAAFATANSAFHQANAAYTRANNSLNANTGGTVTGTITATSFVTTGTFGDIQGANAIYANTFVANTGGYFQFADGSKQYTANAGSGGGGAITVTVAADPPASGNVSGDIWIDANTGNEFTWFTDGDSYQWVELGPIGEKGDKGDTGDVTPGFNQANAAFIVANASFIQANAAFIQANTNATNITVIQGVNLTQNTNISNIEGVNLTQNTNITNAQNSALAAFDHANAAFIQANTNAGNITTIQGVNLTQNTSISDLQGVNLTQNTSISNLEGVNLTQNTNITNAQNKADSAFDQANAAFIQANTNAGNITVIQGVNLTQNTSINDLQAVNVTQNNRITYAENHANAAFNAANNATDTYVRAHANAAFDHANAAYDKANTGGGNITITIDSFTGTGSCTQFTLSVTPTSENYTIVSFDGAVQHKSTYSLSGSVITFSEAPANATEIDVTSFVTLGTSAFLAYNEQFAGTGACTTFTLANTPNDENYTVVSIDGAVQHKSTYSLSGASVIFSEAPPNTSEIDVTYFKSSTLLDSALTVYAANHANAAFIAANNATDTYVRNHANSAFIQANAAFTKANNEGGVNNTQNTNITVAWNTANAAFTQANSKNLVVIGRSTNTYIPIATGKITIEGRSTNTLITIIS